MATDWLTVWTAVGASATVSVAAGAAAAVLVARRELAHLAARTGREAVFPLYESVDAPKRRRDRREIWQRICKIQPDDLTREDWDVVERTATLLDQVGEMVRRELFDADLVFDRYIEVIVPLWDALKPYVIRRRELKGGFGWEQFEWLAGHARRE